MSEEKIVSLIGFANRAGELAIGRSAVIKAFEKKKLAALIIAQDASPKVAQILAEAPLARLPFGTKDELGKILGRDEVAILGILDQGFAKSIKKLFTTEENKLDTDFH